MISVGCLKSAIQPNTPSTHAKCASDWSHARLDQCTSLSQLTGLGARLERMNRAGDARPGKHTNNDGKSPC